MSQLILVIVNGFPRSGKDTFVDMCVNEFALKGFRARNISSVDDVKKAATLLGWDGVKDEKGRKFLSDLKDLSTANYDGPMKYMKEAINNRNDKYDHVFFFHIREPIEIAKFVKEFPQTLTLIIHRNDAEMFNNIGDNGVLKYNYNYHIYNEGSIAQLSNIASKFCITLEELHATN